MVPSYEKELVDVNLLENRLANLLCTQLLTIKETLIKMERKVPRRIFRIQPPFAVLKSLAPLDTSDKKILE